MVRIWTRSARSLKNDATEADTCWTAQTLWTKVQNACVILRTLF